MRSIYTILAVFLLSCSERTVTSDKMLLDKNWLDSIRNESDSMITRLIGAAEFHIAEQLYDTSRKIITKILKDTSGRVRSVVQFRNNRRIHFSEYFANGQLKAVYRLDSAGQFSGESVYYYENGNVKSKGLYKNGLFIGEWQNFSEMGRLEFLDIYDNNGVLIRNERK